MIDHWEQLHCTCGIISSEAEDNKPTLLQPLNENYQSAMLLSVSSAIVRYAILFQLATINALESAEDIRGLRVTATPKPTSSTNGPGGGGAPATTTCCSSSSLGYASCMSSSTCNKSLKNCKKCSGGKWLAVPIVRDGCCSFGGSDCSAIDPTTNSQCQYLSSDCIGCGGQWVPLNATPRPTIAPSTSKVS